jgi:hypothetical protein
MFQHGVDAVGDLPSGLVFRRMKTFLRDFGQRCPPAIYEMLEIPLSLFFYLVGFRGRPDLRVGKFELLTDPRHVAASCSQDVPKEGFQ